MNLNLSFSIIIPVYNRPKEINELLESLLNQTFKDDYEIIIVEDGSTIKSEEIISKYQSRLNITYFYKENTGAGQSRNYGMIHAKGNYYIILDSDVVLPKNYLDQVKNSLQNKYTDAFGGADTTHQSFTVFQKAINYAMTSFLTTGGLRNNKGLSNKFQLRSFNMGISKQAFKKTKGFSKQNFGEDIDLTYKLWNNGFETQFIPKAFVYHKRRANFKQFYKQTFNFGSARPILNKKHKNSSKLTYWFPSIFIIGLLIALIFLIFNFKYLIYLYLIYFGLLFFDSFIQNKNIKVAFLSTLTTLTQFFGYGFGFIRSQFRLNILNKSAKETFPKMFS